MLLLGFLVLVTGLFLVLGFLVQFKTYRQSQRLLLLGVSGLFSIHLWLGYSAVFASSTMVWFGLNRVLVGLGLISSLGLLVITRNFLRNDGGGNGPEGRPSVLALLAVGVAAVEGLLFLSGNLAMALSSGDRILFVGAGLAVPILYALMAVYTLYILESTYRFALDYQRRIGRLCFIGLGVLSGFHLFYFARALLYRELPQHYAEATSVIYGVVYPVVLAGFLRYRLGLESINVSRDTVYTSITVFLAGSSFLGVAVTVIIFRWLRLEFTYFELYLTGFSLCFLVLLIFGSGTMRRRISRFLNKQLYSHKYDYREQFFNLHRTLLSGSDLQTALTELVENMKYSVTVDDAYVFVLNWQDGNFYQHENKEDSTHRGLIADVDGPLARTLARAGVPVDLLMDGAEGLEVRSEIRGDALSRLLRFDAVFPIFIGERLAGILALKGGREKPFDEEDLALIGVFTNSIGDVIFKNRVLKERIEQKQFESFHHVASFIIHDIKNQIATLSLLLKNAERNLGNPSFQASMISSIKSCSVNLQSLIDRLSVAPKSQTLNLAPHPLRPLLEDVVANSGLAAMANLVCELKGGKAEDGSGGESGESGESGEGGSEGAAEEASLPMDRQALFFVIRNLVNNAVEAIGAHGPSGRAGGDRITLSCGALGLSASGRSAPARLRELFGGGEGFFAAYGGYILVEDTGGGMDKTFVQRRLFQPFATTKEKGVGIGLYQCKTLVEKMGGRILCHSELGKGTEFCILLPAAAPAG
jgi:signal transduction histidine kinase